MKLHEVDKPGTYCVTSIHVGPVHARELGVLGIEPGVIIEVLHNDFRGTIGIQIAGELVILGRTETFHIQIASHTAASSQLDSHAPRR